MLSFSIFLTLYLLSLTPSPGLCAPEHDHDLSDPDSPVEIPVEGEHNGEEEQEGEANEGEHEAGEGVEGEHNNNEEENAEEGQQEETEDIPEPLITESDDASGRAVKGSTDDDTNIHHNHTLPERSSSQRELMFNKDRRTKDETGYIDKAKVEEECEAAKHCWASSLVVPICGSNGKTYLNPGVYQCAQRCSDPKNKTEVLSVKHFGPCPGYTMPPTTSTTPKTTVPTTPKHESSEGRVKFLGSWPKRFFKWIGLHVHDDGGVYLDDEQENDAWWNFR